MLRDGRSCLESAVDADEEGHRNRKEDEMESQKGHSISTLKLCLRLVSSIENYGSRTWLDSWRIAERPHGRSTSNTAAQKRDI